MVMMRRAANSVSTSSMSSAAPTRRQLWRSLAGAGHADRRLGGDQRRALGVLGAGARADVLAGQQAAADVAGGA